MKQRFFPDLSDRGEMDQRSAFSRDRARVLHSASFRRLQGKTQIMGIREGDFHRTRLTHSIECAQIGQGLLEVLSNQSPRDFKPWFPERDLIEVACFAHDLGHPPFGHSGEKALHGCMKNFGLYGGFEGNAQTIRILTRLEKYQSRDQGLNPTRRFLLAVLKYPIFYGSFETDGVFPEYPPKCVYQTDRGMTEWAFKGFDQKDRDILYAPPSQRLERLQTFDCSVMELADDIAYGIHDIEDMIGRNLIPRDIFIKRMRRAFEGFQNQQFSFGGAAITAESLTQALYETSYTRKQMISRLVGFCITHVQFSEKTSFQHPLLRYMAILPDEISFFLHQLKDTSMELLIKKPAVAQLTRRGMYIVKQLFQALMESPQELIPHTQNWPSNVAEIEIARKVCDYIAGMTDGYAEKIYGRLFLPGMGNTTDEL